MEQVPVSSIYLIDVPSHFRDRQDEYAALVEIFANSLKRRRTPCSGFQFDPNDLEPVVESLIYLGIVEDIHKSNEKLLYVITDVDRGVLYLELIFHDQSERSNTLSD